VGGRSLILILILDNSVVRDYGDFSGIGGNQAFEEKGIIDNYLLLYYLRVRSFLMTRAWMKGMKDRADWRQRVVPKLIVTLAI
jgi:hypothetical protein